MQTFLYEPKQKKALVFHAYITHMIPKLGWSLAEEIVQEIEARPMTKT